MPTMNMYCHRSAIDFSVGDTVSNGGRLCAADATGRVTGPQRHWSVLLSQAIVDAALFVAA